MRHDYAAGPGGAKARHHTNSCITAPPPRHSAAGREPRHHVATPVLPRSRRTPPPPPPARGGVSFTGRAHARRSGGLQPQRTSDLHPNLCFRRSRVGGLRESRLWGLAHMMPGSAAAHISRHRCFVICAMFVLAMTASVIGTVRALQLGKLEGRPHEPGAHER